MKLRNNLIGKKIYLRTALPEDAEFILSLRLNETLNKHIKKINPSIVNQQIWLEQKMKEYNDYHMIICNRIDDKKLGIIAIYAIDNNKKIFDWGRWVIDPIAPMYAAIESVILIYDFAFFELQLKETLFEVRKTNTKVLNFHNRFGAMIINEDEIFYYFRFTLEIYKKTILKYKKYRGI